MNLNLHCSRSLAKQLDALRRSGRQGRLAVEQCERILDSIRTKGLRCKLLFQKRTKNGELRIGNCVKYDLGHGHRLITIRHGDHLFIPFVGNHARVDQWLDQNRDAVFMVGEPGYNSENLIFSKSDNALDSQQEQSVPAVNQEEDLYEAYLQSQINDELLKSIFSGLVQPIPSK